MWNVRLCQIFCQKSDFKYLLKKYQIFSVSNLILILCVYITLWAYLREMIYNALYSTEANIWKTHENHLIQLRRRNLIADCTAKSQNKLYFYWLLTGNLRVTTAKINYISVTSMFWLLINWHLKCTSDSDDRFFSANLCGF